MNLGWESQVREGHGAYHINPEYRALLPNRYWDNKCIRCARGSHNWTRCEKLCLHCGSLGHVGQPCTVAYLWWNRKVAGETVRRLEKRQSTANQQMTLASNPPQPQQQQPVAFQPPLMPMGFPQPPMPMANMGYGSPWSSGMFAPQFGAYMGPSPPSYQTANPSPQSHQTAQAQSASRKRFRPSAPRLPASKRSRPQTSADQMELVDSRASETRTVESQASEPNASMPGALPVVEDAPAQTSGQLSEQMAQMAEQLRQQSEQQAEQSRQHSQHSQQLAELNNLVQRQQEHITVLTRRLGASEELVERQAALLRATQEHLTGQLGDFLTAPIPTDLPQDLPFRPMPSERSGGPGESS